MQPKPQKDRTLLTMNVNFLLGRYHGSEWPPSPRRLFLALVSALYTGGGRRVDISVGKRSLRLLERKPPVIHAPRESNGCRYKIFVPNNDMDMSNLMNTAKKASGRKPESLKTGKLLAPRNVDGPVCYSWEIDSGDRDDAVVLCRLAKEVPVLGLGIDPVAAYGRIADRPSIPGGLSHYVPDRQNGKLLIQVPSAGLLESAVERHKEYRNRLKGDQYTKPREITGWSEQGYRMENVGDALVGFRVNRVEASQGQFVQKRMVVPDGLAPALMAKMGHLKDACMIGQISENGAPGDQDLRPKGMRATDQALSVKTALLPSIGNKYADVMARRVAFIAPPGLVGPLERLDGETFEIDGGTYRLEKLPENDPVLNAYGSRSRFFAAVTPVRIGQEEEAGEEPLKAILREVAEKVDQPVTFANLQNEPYFGTRPRDAGGPTGVFVELEFASKVAGPFMIGSDQGSGYGLFAPKRVPGVAYFRVLGKRMPISAAVAVGDVMRRAVLSRLGRSSRQVDPAMSGHEADGRPLRQNHDHAFWLPSDSDLDGLIDHVAVYLGGGFDHATRSALAGITRVCDGMDLDMRLQFEGFFSRKNIGKKCPLFGSGTEWVSATPYFMPWHAKKNFQRDDQLKRECAKRQRRVASISSYTIQAAGRPVRPSVFKSSRGNRRPINGVGEALSIKFDKKVMGPVTLGFGCHFGLGTFVPRKPAS